MESYPLISMTQSIEISMQTDHPLKPRQQDIIVADRNFELRKMTDFKILFKQNVTSHITDTLQSYHIPEHFKYFLGTH